MSRNQIIATWTAFVLTAMQNKYGLLAKYITEQGGSLDA